MNFGDKIAVLMLDKALNQEQLANAVGKSQSTVSCWLNGTVPHKRTLKILSDFLGVSEDVLLNDDVDLPSVKMTDKAKKMFPSQEFHNNLKAIRVDAARETLGLKKCQAKKADLAEVVDKMELLCEELNRLITAAKVLIKNADQS